MERISEETSSSELSLDEHFKTDPENSNVVEITEDRCEGTYSTEEAVIKFKENDEGEKPEITKVSYILKWPVRFTNLVEWIRIWFCSQELSKLRICWHRRKREAKSFCLGD